MYVVHRTDQSPPVQWLIAAAASETIVNLFKVSVSVYNAQYTQSASGLLQHSTAISVYWEPWQRL